MNSPVERQRALAIWTLDTLTIPACELVGDDVEPARYRTARDEIDRTGCTTAMDSDSTLDAIARGSIARWAWSSC